MKQENITGMPKTENSLGAAAILLKISPLFPPVFFVVTTAIGAVRWFSPVPFWDMWDGTLQFYVARLQGARWSPFLEQANEHRIILSKILFWIDYRFFHGLSYFLIASNLALMLALWLALCAAARALMGGNRRLTYLCCALIAVPCFSWLQAENINWGYQSQFYMAYLLPLLALISMARWIHAPDRTRWLASAVVLGMLSTITMANGILALPLLIVMLLLSGRCTKWRLIGLVVISAVTLAGWLYHYQRMPHESAPFRMMAKFLLMFLGAPLGWLFHLDPLTMLGGAAVICASAYLAVRWLRGATRDPMFLAMLLFVAHIGAAGAAATISRAHFGLGAALAGRYETPAMLLYSSLLLMFVHLYRNRIGTAATVRTLSVVVPVMLFTPQWGSIDPTGPEIARQRMQSALALDLGIDDRLTIGRVYPEDSADQVAQVHRAAGNGMRYNLSVFALPELKSARAHLGQPASTADLQPCHGNIDATTPVASDPNYIKLNGWVFNEATKRTPNVAFIVSNGLVVGAVLTGLERPDVTQTINPNAKRAGFEGYAMKFDPGSISIFCER
ncbi:hypothetical protein R69746_07755 [Paraburkholderia aspalathi]|uniref:hypothetical protein n=1 Tax=Paraburkholderia aspalathi TaxID=1324617 RepID=UPI00190B4C15|nr:hypothetical protein [Paraburkholderia aspalathi]MBK3843739.1 hypothetical protein [Paraburkholderia aspalathi]CAE6859728.1 hypothetical protein R69746_07755 [Paraburkholderia aspalathi]